MARMFPRTVPRYIREDPRRGGEMRVYDALRKQVPDTFDVYYSTPWLATRADGSEVDGECDFLVAHPDLGIVAIEVKGGRIRIDSDNQWKTTNRDDITLRIKNPVDQARNAKHQFIRRLRERTGSWVTASHGVILPHTKRPADGRDLRPDAPLRLFAFEQDIDHLYDWLLARAADGEGPPGSTAGGRGIGAEGMAALHDILARPIQLHDRLRPYVGDDLDRIDSLTKEQLDILQSLRANRRVAISGAAGTGKTFLAAEKALRLAGEGKRVLFLCFNSPLAAHLRELVGTNAGVVARSFHGFWKEAEEKAAARSGRAARGFTDLDDAAQAEALVDALTEWGEPSFDALIVDEGQDFHDSWFEALEMALADGHEGVVYVFYDDNQKIVARSAAFIDRLDCLEYGLHKNLRNTKKIHHIVDRFYRGLAPVVPIGPDGADVGLIACSGLADGRARIVRLLGDLQENEGIPLDSITVLAPSGEIVEALAPDGRLGRHRTTRAGTGRDEMLCVDSIGRFKGLESPVVILYLDERATGDQELIYTGLSRAKAVLRVVGPQRLIAELGRTGEER